MFKILKENLKILKNVFISFKVLHLNINKLLKYFKIKISVGISLNFSNYRVRCRHAFLRFR